MSNAPQTVADLIDAFGRIGDFADAIGCPYQTARQMRRREAIAVKHWPRLVEACQERGIEGVTFEWLVGCHAEGRDAA
jgi:hypothetical protein